MPASDADSCPLSWSLFLLSSWDDPAAGYRRARCRVPESASITGRQLVLDTLDELGNEPDMTKVRYELDVMKWKRSTGPLVDHCQGHASGRPGRSLWLHPDLGPPERRLIRRELCCIRRRSKRFPSLWQHEAIRSWMQ